MIAVRVSPGSFSVIAMLFMVSVVLKILAWAKPPRHFLFLQHQSHLEHPLPRPRQPHVEWLRQLLFPNHMATLSLRVSPGRVGVMLTNLQHVLAHENLFSSTEETISGRASPGCCDECDAFFRHSAHPSWTSPTPNLQDPCVFMLVQTLPWSLWEMLFRTNFRMFQVILRVIDCIPPLTTD